MKNTNWAVLSIVLIMFQSLNLFGQKQGDNWIFGTVCQLCDTIDYGFFQMHFENDTFEINDFRHLSKRTMDFTNTSLSDSTGNLFLYSEGINIYDKNDKIIENGALFPAKYDEVFPCAHCATILPLDNSGNRAAFIFLDFFKWLNPTFMALDASGRYVSYNEVVKDATSDELKVTIRDEKLIFDTLEMGQMATVRHGNGRDWWMLVNEDNSNRFFRILVDPSGAKLHGEQRIGFPVKTSLGQSSYSPNGKWFAKYNATAEFTSSLDIYHFNRCSGLLSNHLQIQMDSLPNPGGLAFAPSSRYLYVAVWDRIYQYDLQAADIEKSAILVATYDGFMDKWMNVDLPTRFFMMSLAPDKKIYITVPNVESHYLHVISQPDLAGLACKVQQHHVRLPFFNSFSIPNNPWYALKDWDGSPCDSLITPVGVFQPKNVGLELRVFPNPATNQINIELKNLPFSNELKLKVLDVSGKVIREMPLDFFVKNLSLNVSNLLPGIYFVEIFRENKPIKTAKFSIIR